MRRIHITLCVLMVLLICLMCRLTITEAQDAKPKPGIQGQVVDEKGEPAANVRVAMIWLFENDTPEAWKGVKTDNEGRFTLPLQRKLRTYVAVTAYNDDMSLGGFAAVDSSTAGKIHTIQLRPTVEVTGSYQCEALGHAPHYIKSEVYAVVDETNWIVVRVALRRSKDNTFRFRLPRGLYSLYAHGDEVQSLQREMDLIDAKGTVDLGVCDMDPSLLASHIGNPLPDWSLTETRGVDSDVALKDFEGKWVLLEFWGFW